VSLVGLGHPKDKLVIKRPACDLDADGKACLGQSHGDGNGGQPDEIIDTGATGVSATPMGTSSSSSRTMDSSSLGAVILTPGVTSTSTSVRTREKFSCAMRLMRWAFT
jgi:hypothetical protein